MTRTKKWVAMILCNPRFLVVAFSPSTSRRLSKIYNPVCKSRKCGISRIQMVFEVSGMDDMPLPPVHDVEQSKTTSTKQIIDNILDECLRYSARRPIMIQFDPASRAIMRHWRGTVLAETYKPAAWMALWAVVVFVLFQRYPTCVHFFKGFHKIWGELLAVTTFTLTFFVNEAYSCWRKCLDICYTLQGRLNDLSMALAGCAKRVEPSSFSDPNSDETTSKFTPQSRKILTIIARYIRLFNILSYASFTRSHRPLLTPQGMRQMIRRGLLTDKEHSILINSRVTATARHNVVLMWAFRMAIDARKAGHFEGGFGYEQNILLRVEEIRSCGNWMECILRGRMPFGYAHIVQVLVSLVTWLYPIMAFSSSTSLQIGVIGVIFLTMTYQGLIDLSKRFLDPFHNENFWDGFDPIRVDTLIAETNAGSRRWMFGLEDMPIPLQAIQDSGRDLDLFILPDEGISAEEASQMEAAKETAKAAMMELSKQGIGEDRLEDEQQIFQEEFEETQAILSAPPGADFVPGLDDVEGEEECTMYPELNEDMKACEDKDDEGLMSPPNEVFDLYMESLTEEYEDVLRQDTKEEH
eukprot:CAMPEP_0181076280 /NCGR_PEP_ID=MMETSP1071-20121207/336_1 /TAXON_ID=35127 /ORGANISM="Thalassiosira sp., Strain NH16" /LENGTH=580 /DNA_ID=CAMNT_0023157453 /DNA_START=153 /DNA_END=1892 /DNA_ORIENTATION=-